MKAEDGPGKGLNMLLLHQLCRPSMTGTRRPNLGDSTYLFVVFFLCFAIFYSARRTGLLHVGRTGQDFDRDVDRKLSDVASLAAQIYFLTSVWTI
jgi:hypothetical protein